MYGAYQGRASLFRYGVLDALDVYAGPTCFDTACWVLFGAYAGPPAYK